MHYRSDVDGLRAVAILPVILFHAGLGPFTGGYVGVDVFFVISGFLITGILTRDLEKDRFSILTFYERRARRLFPALAIVLIATTIGLFYVGFPEDLETYSKSLVYVSGFVANFYFWLNLGYFDVSAEMQPLLHMWSLAVEEQYYILFPLLLWALYRGSEKTRKICLWAILLFSFVLCVVGIADHPEATFFLLPTRAWELLAGGLVALQMRGTYPKGRGIWAVVGLVLILVAIFAFENTTPYPSHFTLLPVVGTVLIIRYNAPGTLVHKILSYPPIVAIGLISYSAYLWHQPIIVLARIKLAQEPTTLQMCGLIILTLVLAALTWKLIEQPFRGNPPRLLPGLRPMIGTAAVGLMAFVALGIAGQRTDGFQSLWLKYGNPGFAGIYPLIQARNEITPDPNPGPCRFYIDEDKENLLIVSELTDLFISCHTTHGPGVAVIGDSHARNLYRAMRVNSDHPFLIGLTGNGCRPGHDPQKCPFNDLSALLQENPDVFSAVIHEEMGRILLVDPENEEKLKRSEMNRMPLDQAFPENYVPDLEFIRVTKKYLHNLPGNAKKYWLGPRMEPYIVRGTIAERGCKFDYQLRENTQDKFKQVDKAIAELSADSDFTYLSQIDILDMQFPEDLLSCSALFYADGDHLSSAGEERFGARLDLMNRLDLN